MLDLFLSPQAKDDLSKIYEFTFNKWGQSQADKYQDELFRAMQLLIENPDLGKPYTHFKTPYRKFHINRHLLFYKTESKKCIIIRVLHDRMNTRRIL